MIIGKNKVLVTKGIIYYLYNKTKAKRKLEEIIAEKAEQGIKPILYNDNNIVTQIAFSDGDEWRLALANHHMRGLRWHKAYVEKEIPLEIIQDIIKPMGIYKIEDFKWF